MRGQRGKFRVLGMLLTIIVVMWTVLGSTAPTYGQTASADLVAKVEAQGTIRVIVRLNIPFQPVGNLPTAQDIQAQTASIQQVQNTLLATIPGYDATSVVNLQYIPYTAMTVDTAGLQALLQSPQVVNVAEDKQMTLFLDNSITLIGANQAWSSGYSGSGQSVAIIDSGVDKNHWFLSGRVVAEACFSTTNTVGGTQMISTCPNGQNQQIGAGAGMPCPMADCIHGTHVAGITAGRGTDFNGVARDASIIAINVASKVSTLTGDALTIQFSDVARALEHVYSLRNSFSIASVNMSLGTNDVYAGTCDTVDASYTLVKDAVDEVRSAGIAVIAASGNGGQAAGISMPACLSNTISVGATSAEPETVDRFAAFSNSSSELDLLAPGISINSSAPNNAMASLGGTSMAAPHVAGAWAVLKHAAPSASINSILSALKTSGIPLTDPRNQIVTPRIQIEDATALLTGIQAAPPFNDMAGNATYITSLPFFDYRLNRHSTDQPNLPTLTGACAGITIGKDVWYRYDATTTENLILQTQGSSFDTVIAVWSGLPGVPQLVACNDNIGAGSNQSRLTLAVAAGKSYYIQVGGRSGAIGALHFDMGRGTTHDLIANAKIVGQLPYRDAANTDSTTSTGDPHSSCLQAWFDPLNSVWYRYTATGNDRIMIDTVGSDYNSFLAVWSGTPGNLTEITCMDDLYFDATTSSSSWELNAEVSLQVTTGTTYYIQASGKEAFFTDDPSGELKLNIRRLLAANLPALVPPTLITPTNGAQLAQSQPTLKWNVAANAMGYEIQIGTTNPPTNAPIQTGNIEYVATDAVLINTYYWRVRSIGNANNGVSNWSETRSFTITAETNTAPQRNLFTTPTPTLTWGSVSWATGYELEVAKDLGFINKVYQSGTITGNSVTVGPLQPGVYYFRVRALQGTTQGNWSAVDSFVIVPP